VKWSAQNLKIAADHGYAFAQNNYGLILYKGEGVSIDFKGAAYYFKLAADQSLAEAQDCYSICLITGDTVHRNLAGAFRYLKLSVENGSTDGQFVVACMAENGIGAFSSIGFEVAVQNYERCSDFSPQIPLALGGDYRWELEFRSISRLLLSFS
jgi:hypothetical protein